MDVILTAMLAPSVVPPSRLFPAPKVPFDTELALVSAGNVAFQEIGGVTYVAAEDGPSHPRYALVREGLAIDAVDAAHAIVTRLRWRSPGPAIPTQRVVLVETGETAEAMTPVFLDSGLARSALTFWAIRADELAKGERLVLEPLIGDEAWRAWASVEREILAESIAPAVLTEAQLDRSVHFKRRQQRESPPIRRFVAAVPGSDGAPVAMIGYAPFSACDIGIGAPGVLVRLRDVAVLAGQRRRGLGAALLRALAARAIDECGATQVLIGGVSEGQAASLYQKVGAHPIAGCVMFAGALG